MLNELDIHGLYVKEAKQVIDIYLNQLPKGIHEVVIIHGYQRGNSLQSFVRKQYMHRLVDRTMVSMNPGETILVLKNK